MISHQAIPSRDIVESTEFYTKLGCAIGRYSLDFAIINFFGQQLVCHVSEKYERVVTMYPRHLGVIFENESNFFNLYSFVKSSPFLNAHIFEEQFVRNLGKKEEHHSFFLKDPSNNLIEFKWYRNENAIFGA